MKTTLIALAALCVCPVHGLFAQINMAGTWQISSASTTFNSTSSGLAQIGESSSTLAGTATLTGAPCASAASFTGTLTGSQLVLNMNEDGQIVVLSGTVAADGNSANGTYRAPEGGCTDGDQGTWAGAREADGIPTTQTVLSAASFGAPVAPGSLVAIFGLNLATQFQNASVLPLPTTLGEASAQFNELLSLPLLATTPGQLNGQIPWELSGFNSASIAVSVLGRTGPLLGLTLASVAPAIFTLNQQGFGQGAIQISNTSTYAAPAGSVPDAQAQPATRGQSVTIYATGLGNVSNRPASGAPAQSNPTSATLAPVSVTIGGFAAPVSFAGLTPTLVGLYQVNAEVPGAVAIGDAVPVTLTIDGITSNTVTMAVQ